MFVAVRPANSITEQDKVIIEAAKRLRVYCLPRKRVPRSDYSVCEKVPPFFTIQVALRPKPQKKCVFSALPVIFQIIKQSPLINILLKLKKSNIIALKR
jgi:hypothetical protein